MRKEKTITIKDRDNELTFKIREMPATRLESWLLRAGLLLAGSGAFDGADVRDASEAINKAGAVLSKGGISSLANIDIEKAQPLLEELLACCTRIDAGIEQQLTPEITDSIIEDVKTLFTLRKEALLLNCGFFLGGEKSESEKEKKLEVQSQRKILVHSKQQ